MVRFPDEALEAESIIVSGPPKTGEYRLFLELLAQLGTTRIVIATGMRAGEIREHYAQHVEEAETVRVVDCISAGRGETPPEDEFTRFVDGPGNLTSIGVKVTSFLEELPDDPDAVVGLYTLTQLLLHAGMEQTYQFTHILAQQTAAEGIPLVAVINDRAHDEQTVSAMHQRFDCIVETRDAGTSNEYRTRTALEATDWQEM